MKAWDLWLKLGEFMAACHTVKISGILTRLYIDGHYLPLISLPDYQFTKFCNLIME